MLTIIQAQCGCSVWPVVEGFQVRDCGRCGARPIVLPMIRLGVIRLP